MANIAQSNQINMNPRMTLQIFIQEGEGLYYQVKEKQGSFHVFSTSKKPKGGAKRILEKIYRILLKLNLSGEVKASLSAFSQKIWQRYMSRNPRSKSLDTLIKEIAKMTAPFDRESYRLITQALPLPDLTRLASVSRDFEPLVKSEILRRMQQIGWNPEIFTSYEIFYSHLAKGLKYLACERILENKEAYLNEKMVYKIMKKQNFFCSLFDLDFEAVCCFLIQKTMHFRGRELELDFKEPFLIVASRFRYQSSLAAPLLAELNRNLNLPVDLFWYVRELNVEASIAARLLHVFSDVDLNAVQSIEGNQKKRTALGYASFLGRVGWVSALIRKKVDLNKGIGTTPIKDALKRTSREVIALLLDAGVELPWAKEFYLKVLQYCASDVVVRILDVLSCDSKRMEALCQDGTLLKKAVNCNHSKDVINKLR